MADLRCSATFGRRSAAGDPYGGGRTDLRCDDGSALSGTLRDERLPVEDASANGILDLAATVSR